MTDPSGVRVELVAVSPKKAREWLGRNVDNQRLLRARKVSQYARDMAAGHWPITGDTVKVTANNALLDGQHRMAAVVQADTVVPMLVAFNVDPAVMPVLDSGLGRSFADVLKVSGAPERSLTGSIVRRVLMWEQGNPTGRTTEDYPTHTEMLARWEKDPAGFAASTARGRDCQRAGIGQGTAAGTAHFLFTAVDHDATNHFFDAYVSGANLPQSHPILSLRNRMARLGRDERLRAHEQIALIVRAWNAYREARPLDRVMITSAGRKLTNANFPMPK